MKTLEELLIDENFLKLKKKIKQKFSFLDCDDIESAYHLSVWQSHIKQNNYKNIKLTTLFYRIFCLECLTLCRSYVKNKQLPINYDKLDFGLDINQLLENLSEDDRNLLLQRYLEQKTLEEIGMLAQQEGIEYTPGYLTGGVNG